MDKAELLKIIDQAARDKVTQLNLAEKGIIELPPEIGKLTNLTKFYLGGNQLTSLPPEIVKLTNLTELILFSNQLCNLPLEIVKLTNLTGLFLGGNQLSSLPPEIDKLTNLRELNLGGSQLRTLPPEIGKLTNLRFLDLGGNQLRTLPPEIDKLTNLEKLWLNNNELSNLPPEIGKLTQLKILQLWNNQISSLPPELGNLTNLEVLGLRGSQLNRLPPEIAKLTNLERLDLRDNQLDIPPEILSGTDKPTEILNYYFKSLEEEMRPLNEAKMILVGQGGVGKTSLVKRLIDGTYNKHENMTKGIEIRKWAVALDGDKIQLNVWDFGGQEIMHATHQFFMTKRSLYILVLDSRQGEHESRVEYWLKLIESFADDSPVIVVCNKCDQHPIDLDWTGLQKKYPSIKEFVKKVSCDSGEGIAEVKDEIAKAISTMAHVRENFIKSWLDVKRKLESMSAHFITHQKYEGMCKEAGIDQMGQRTLIGFLHDLGIVVSFRDDPRLCHLDILNPAWVTEGVYKILNSRELFESKGILEKEKIRDILDPVEYPAERQMLIIDMMKKFELCFSFDGTQEKYLIPGLLEKEERYIGNWDDSLAFQIHYDVLPGSFISRFMVRMHAHILDKTLWRNGVLLASIDGKNEAVVKADPVDGKIFINVRGDEDSRREFLAVIRAPFHEIHETISGIEAKEKIPIPDQPDIVVDYEYLLDLESMGETSFVPVGLRKSVNVKDLLRGVDTESKRFSDENLNSLTAYKREEDAEHREDIQEEIPEPVKLDTRYDRLIEKFKNNRLFVAIGLVVSAVIIIGGAFDGLEKIKKFLFATPTQTPLETQTPTPAQLVTPKPKSE